MILIKLLIAYFFFKEVKGSKASHSIYRQIFENQETLPTDFDAPKIIRKFRFQQKLDHFSNQTMRWKQYYYADLTNFVRNGSFPVFIFINEEKKASSYYLTAGAMKEYADEVNAICFILEHRFYGSSQPGVNTSNDNLRYLTSIQAIEDVAEFIRYIKARLYLTDANKIVTFGGSYGGSLSLWMRQKYPDLVSGAVSSSGPLRAKVDFFEYLSVMDSTLMSMDQDCGLSLRIALQEFDDKYNSGIVGQRRIAKDFMLCNKAPIDRLSVQILLKSILIIFASKNQYHRAGTSNDLNIVCRQFSRFSSAIGPYRRLVRLTRKIYGLRKGACNRLSFPGLVAEYNDVSLATAKNFNMRQWIYQTCNEFGWFQNPAGMPQTPYGSIYDTELYLTLCSQLFDIIDVENRVQETNDHYGSLTPNVTNVVVTHGFYDPWKSMGLSTSDDETVPVIIIEGASHCEDLKSVNTLNTTKLAETKATVLRHIRSWIN